MKYWLKSWRTTALGLIAAIMVGLAPFAVPGATFSKANIGLAVIIAFFGAVCKDFTHTSDKTV